jgi:hypothetical protein
MKSFQVQRKERYGSEKVNIGNVEYWNNNSKDEQKRGRKSTRTNLKYEMIIQNAVTESIIKASY